MCLKTLYMHEICLRCAWDMPDIYLTFSEIYQMYAWDMSVIRSVGISECYEMKYINECCNGTVLKPRTLYKGNFIKYKGKSWKSVFWNFKWLVIFKSCLMILVCIPEALTDLSIPILPYITIRNVACQMRHLCQKCQKCHIWPQCHSTHVMHRYGNMGVKRCAKASGLQSNAIKQLVNKFNCLKCQNTDFWNFQP